MTTATEERYLPAMGLHALLPAYDPLTRLLGVPAAHRRLLDGAALRPGARVLEIGCGTGNLALLAKQRHPAVAVVASDPDPRALDRARAKAAAAGLDVTFERAFATALPQEDDSADHVLSAFMLHHLDRDAQLGALREVRRVLAPGGMLELVDVDAAGFGARLRHGRTLPLAEALWEAGLVARAVIARRTRIGRLRFVRASPGPACASPTACSRRVDTDRRRDVPFLLP